jgi:hypothetical protein
LQGEEEVTQGLLRVQGTTHFITDYPKRKKLKLPTSMTTPTGMTPAMRATTRRGTASETRRSSRRSCLERMLPWANFDFSSDYSSSSEEDEKVKCKKRDFIGLCLMTKGGSSRNVSDSDSDVSEDLSFKSLSQKVAKLENALCNQDKLLCKVFRENKKLNLELK